MIRGMESQNCQSTLYPVIRGKSMHYFQLCKRGIRSMESVHYFQHSISVIRSMESLHYYQHNIAIG